MSTSRRSSKSTNSTTTTRSNRPPTWRATNHISSNAPGPALILSKNSSAPEVSIVTAEPETGSSSVLISAASHLAPTISKRPELYGLSSIERRRRVEQKNSTKTRLQDVFSREDSGDRWGHIEDYATQSEHSCRIRSGSIDTDPGVAFPSISSPALLESTNENSTAFPSTNAESTLIPHVPVQPKHGLSSSSSPSQGTWFGSFGRSIGKGKAAEVDTITVLSNLTEDTPRPASHSLTAVPINEAIDNVESLNSAIEALGSKQPCTETIRAASCPSVTDLPSRAEDLSKTVRGLEGPKPPKHSWFNPFAPYPSRSQNISSQSPSSQPSSPSASPSTSPTSCNPMRNASSYVGSIDDEVPGPIRTPALSDDEDGQDVQQAKNHLSSILASNTGDTAGSKDGSPLTSIPSHTSEPRERLDSLSSLNPSTSRFSISIPLLGRPKMRLADAVKREKEIDDNKEVKEIPEHGSAPIVRDIAEATSTTAVSSTTATPFISTPSLSLDPLTSTTINTASTIAERGRADSTELAMSIPSSQPVSEETIHEFPSSSLSVSHAENKSDIATRNDASSAHGIDVADAPAQSWWSYVGWGSFQPNVTRTETPAPEVRIDSNEDGTPNPDTTQFQPPNPLPERCISAPPIMEPSNTSPESAESKTKLLSNPEISLLVQSHTENQADAKAPSIFSLDAARAAGSWFNPWAWYGYGAVEPSSSNPTQSTFAVSGGTEESGGLADGDTDDKVDKTEMTESEKIKEAALARDRSLDDTTSSPASLTAQGESNESHASTSMLPIPVEAKTLDLRPQHVDFFNPIADSASSMRSGWTSFFSLSRGILTKKLGDVAPEIEGVKDEIKKDENGMEVMELTEDETGSVNVNLQEPVLVHQPEKAITKVPTSSALILMRALAGHDSKRQKAIELSKDEKVEQEVADTDRNPTPLPPSPNPSTNTSKYNSDVHDVISIPGSPTKAPDSRPGRASSVSTTQTTSSVSTKPAPPLTISDDLKASVAAAKKGKRTGVSPVVGPSSLPKDSISTPTLGPDGLKKEKEKSKSAAKSGTSTPAPPPPNLVLPTWEDTFHTLPRSTVPEQYLPANNAAAGFGTTIGKTMRYMSGMLLGADSGDTSGGENSRLGAGASATKRRSRRTSSRRRSISGENVTPVGEAELIARERRKLRELLNWGQNLPRAWEVLDNAIENRRKSSLDKKGKIKASIMQEGSYKDVTRGCKKVVVIGIHGWFPGAVMRSMLGEPTGTSSKFVNMMEQALENFQSAYGVTFDKVTKIPLEGEGTINRRVEKLYSNLLSNDSWVDDIHSADVIFVATHSQGSVVSTHLIDRLIRERHIRTAKNGASEPVSDLGVNVVPQPPQRVCCLCLCGIHLGPLRYLSSSSLLQPYIQYFETAAARELFEFQNTESDVSKAYVEALKNVLHNEIKMVYVASLNDQVVPLYSGLFTSACHPLILRALYIDGDAYHSSDFLTNLLVLLLRIMNCGLSDSGLLAHLSEATAGSLSGIGHSTAYEELSTFSLAVKYLFLSNSGFDDHPELTVGHFNATHEMNDYEIPWALRDLIADEKVVHYFSQEITQLRDAFREWHPKTTILRDIKRKLQPIQRLPTTSTPGTASNTSKL